MKRLQVRANEQCSTINVAPVTDVKDDVQSPGYTGPVHGGGRWSAGCEGNVLRNFTAFWRNFRTGGRLSKKGQSLRLSFLNWLPRLPGADDELL